MPGGSLQLGSVSRAMAGRYICEATNSRGVARAETEAHQHHWLSVIWDLSPFAPFHFCNISMCMMCILSECKRVSFQ